MIAKRSVYISAVVAIAMSIFYFYQFTKINRSVNEKQFSFDMPKITAIKRVFPKGGLSEYSYVWGRGGLTGSTSMSSGAATLTKLSQKGYIYKKINGVPSICSASNNSYRWEFYGVTYKNDNLRAVFYNPALKKVKVLSSDKQLDNDLIIEKINPDGVIVEYGKKTFILKIFTFNSQKGEKK